jgi:hypothetical protein
MSLAPLVIDNDQSHSPSEHQQIIDDDDDEQLTLSWQAPVVLDRLCRRDPTLTSIKPWWMMTRDDARALIRQGLPGNTLLTELDFSGLDLWPTDCTELATALPSAAVTHLLLSENNLGDDGLQRLSEGLMAAPSPLVQLELREIGATAADLPALTRALPQCPSLTSLSLEGNHLEDAGAVLLAAALSLHPALQCLRLGMCAIGLAGMEALATALQINSTLVLLDLHGNNCECRGAAALAASLTTSNTQLRSLSLADNGIDDRGIAHLARALIYNTTLDSLSLAGNPFSGAGVATITQALAANATVTNLSMDIFTSAPQIVLEPYLERNGHNQAAKQSSLFVLLWSLLTSAGVAARRRSLADREDVIDDVQSTRCFLGHW